MGIACESATPSDEKHIDAGARNTISANQLPGHGIPKNSFPAMITTPTWSTVLAIALAAIPAR